MSPEYKVRTDRPKRAIKRHILTLILFTQKIGKMGKVAKMTVLSFILFTQFFFLGNRYAALQRHECNIV